MAHSGIIHTIQVDDVIPILPPAVGWVAAATLILMFFKNSSLGGTKMWLNGFHIVVLIMLYCLVTSTLFLLVEATYGPFR